MSDISKEDPTNGIAGGGRGADRTIGDAGVDVAQSQNNDRARSQGIVSVRNPRLDHA